MDQVFNRIGVGRSHIFLYVLLCLIEILNAYQIVIISLISPYLKKQWNLDERVEDIPLYFYAGIILGSLTVGQFANYAGRKPALVVGLVLQLTGNSLLLLNEQFITFLGNIFMLGAGIGITLVTGSTLCTQLLPQNYRGRGLLFLNFISIPGKLLAILFATQFQLSEWKNSQIYSFIVCLALVILIPLKAPESVRMLLVKGRQKQALYILQSMLDEQNKEALSQNQKQQLTRWSKQNEKQAQKHSSYSQIFKNQYLKTTIILSLNWFIVNFIFYGQLFIMPFMMQGDNDGFTHFTLMICGEIPSIFFTSSMIDNQKLGRRYSLACFFLLATLLNCSLIYSNSIIIIAAARLAMKSIFQILYPLTAQSYSTPYRASGLAFSSGIGRIGSIVMPLVIYPLFKVEPYYVFLAFMGFSMLGLYTSLAVSETLHKNIDQKLLTHTSDQTLSLYVKGDIEFGIKTDNY